MTTGDVTPYLNLVTSEHRDKPDFIAFLTLILQPLADAQALLHEMTEDFDLDTAVGVQLDMVGLWIGFSRWLSVPINGVYFTFDTGPGFDIGVFKGPFDPSNQLVQLPDGPYRLALTAKAAANQWDGTIDGAYAAYAILFQGTPFSVLIYDFEDMSMALALVGGIPDALTLALFTGGYMDLKPAGVRIRYYAYPVVTGPIFAFDLPPSSLTAGFDVGHFAGFAPGS